MLATERLHIFPLETYPLLDYLLAENIYESSMGYTENNRVVSADLKEMIEGFTIPKMQQATADNFVYYTIWPVVEKASNSIVAELGFKGEPTASGMVEIGYGTMPAYEGKGIMTEAVSAMVQWCKQQPVIQLLMARTEKDNTASARILQKNGFVLQGVVEDDLLEWHLPV